MIRRAGRTRLRRALLAAAAALLAAAGPLWAAAEGRIDRVEVTPAAGEVRVSAHLAGGFPDEIAEQIQSGVPKDLFYTVTMNRRHRRWFDEELYGRTVSYAIKFDTLEGRYHIRRTDPDGSQDERVVPTYDAAVAMVSEIDGIALPLPPEAGDAGHYVAVKAEMRAVRMPLYLDYVFFFIPMLQFETPWARSAAPEAAP